MSLQWSHENVHSWSSLRLARYKPGKHLPKNSKPSLPILHWLFCEERPISDVRSTRGAGAPAPQVRTICMAVIFAGSWTNR